MNNIWNKVPALLIIVLVVCLFINHSVKKKAFENSINEELVENLIIGSFVEAAPDTDVYIICTEENIEHVEIEESYVSMSIFGPHASVTFDVDLSVNGLYLCTNGRLSLDYSNESPCGWLIDSVWINKDAEVKE